MPEIAKTIANDMNAPKEAFCKLDWKNDLQ